MDRTGKLKLELVDVHGHKLNEAVDIELKHQTLSERRMAKAQPSNKTIVVGDLIGAPNGMYRMLIDPPSYLPVAMFVNAGDGTKRTITFPVDPDKIVDVRFPPYASLQFAHKLLDASRKVLNFSGLTGEELYKKLDRERRAGLLNILAKSRRTPLPEGGAVLDRIQEIEELRGDRCFARVTRDLLGSVSTAVGSGLFREVSGALHRREGWEAAGSYKTDDRYGNLQITFFTRGGECLADIDIDDAAGLEHLFQVARNHLHDRPTNPFSIRDILIRHQEIDPGYEILMREEEALTAAASREA